MKRFATAAGALLLAATLPAHALAQGEDARVLPRGWVELRVGGTYTQFDSRFGDGGTEPLGARFETQVQTLADRLLEPIVPPLRTRLSAFFAGTAGAVTAPVTPEEVEGGAAEVRISSDHRYAPFTLSYGLTPRITVGVTVPIERRGTPVQGIRLAGATLGANPNATANAAVLGEIDTAYAALGSSPFLPLAGSAAGQELQRRVKALTADDDSLVLPTIPAGFAQLRAVPALAALLTPNDTAALGRQGTRTDYALGDVEVAARMRILGAAPPYPGADSAVETGFRSTLGVRVRLPTGVRDTRTLLEVPPTSGHVGVGVDLLNDVFLSSRFWLTVGGTFDQSFGADVQRLAFTEEEPFPRDTLDFRTLRREPGSRISLWLTPRYRLTREFGFAAQYAFTRQGETTFSAADDAEGAVLLGPIETAEAWTAHQVGLGMSYSTIEAFRRGRTPVPLEVYLLYRNVVAGAGGAPHAGSMEVSARVPYQLFGRPRRPRPEGADSAAVDSAAVRPPAQPETPRTPVDRPRVTPPGEQPPAQPRPVEPRPAPAPAPAPPPPPPAPAPPPSTQPTASAQPAAAAPLSLMSGGGTGGKGE